MLHSHDRIIQHKVGLLNHHRMMATGPDSLTQLAQTIAQRVGRFLERVGLLERDADDCIDAGGRAAHGAVAENSYLAPDAPNRA